MGVSSSGVRRTCIHAPREKATPLFADIRNLSTLAASSKALLRLAVRDRELANKLDGVGDLVDHGAADRTADVRPRWSDCCLMTWGQTWKPGR